VSLSAAQLAMRRTGITATDVVILASGSDHYGRTVHDVYREKVYGPSNDVAPTEAMRLGDELEPLVLRSTEAKRGLRITGAGKTIRHAKVKHHLATPDAFARLDVPRSPPGLIQAKVVGFHQARAWGEDGTGVDSIPETVFVQVAWELYVSGRRIEYVGALIGTEVRTYVVDADSPGVGVDELVEGLRDLVDRFWTDHVKPRRAPDVDGSEGAERMLRAMWPRPKRPAMLAPAAAETLAAKYFRARQIEAKAAAARKVAQQELEALVGPHEGMTGDGWRLTWKHRDAVPIPATVRRAYRHFDLRAKKG
jgi:predicted phage-related endonuclease